MKKSITMKAASRKEVKAAVKAAMAELGLAGRYHIEWFTRKPFIAQAVVCLPGGECPLVVYM